MKRLDRGLLVAAMGALVLLVGSTDLLTRYLRPTMELWLVVAGSVLVALGVADLATTARTARRGEMASRGPASPDGTPSCGPEHQPSRVGWLLALPVVLVVLVNPGAIGSYSVLRQSNVRSSAFIRFDLARHLAAGSFGGQAVALNVAQVHAAAEDPSQAKLLAATPVRIEGFVVNDVDRPDQMTIARVVLGCCAGDGVAATLSLRGYEGEPLPDDQWVRVTATLDRTATRAERSQNRYADNVLALEALEKIAEPREPYLYP